MPRFAHIPRFPRRGRRLLPSFFPARSTVAFFSRCPTRTANRVDLLLFSSLLIRRSHCLRCVRTADGSTRKMVNVLGSAVARASEMFLDCALLCCNSPQFPPPSLPPPGPCADVASVPCVHQPICPHPPPAHPLHWLNSNDMARRFFRNQKRRSARAFLSAFHIVNGRPVGFRGIWRWPHLERDPKPKYVHCPRARAFPFFFHPQLRNVPPGPNKLSDRPDSVGWCDVPISRPLWTRGGCHLRRSQCLCRRVLSKDWTRFMWSWARRTPPSLS